MPVKVRLDMDGCIADFTGHAFAAHGKPVPDRPEWEMGQSFGITLAEFQEPMTFDFWATIPWTPEGKDLLAGLEAIFGREVIRLVTSPFTGGPPGCWEGKHAWLLREAPFYAERMHMTHCKGDYAGRSHLLIDDKDANIDAFTKNGGFALTIPRSWNRLERLADAKNRFDVPRVLAAARQWRRAGRADGLYIRGPQ